MKSKKSVEKLKNQQKEGEGQGKGQGLGDEKGREKSLTKEVSEEEGEGIEIPYIYRSPNDDKFNDFDGPVKERRYTDVFCSFLIFIVWITTTGIGVYATINGDYRIVLYPMDYDGNICGTDIAKGGIPSSKESGNEEVSPKVDVSDYPKIVYVNNFGGGVCGMYQVIIILTLLAISQFLLTTNSIICYSCPFLITKSRNVPI